MSLIDTINAAKKEAEGNVALPNVDKSKEDEKGKGSKQGYSRRSAAGAKPAREAAAGVRVVGSGAVDTGKPMSEMTKEEKKAARRANRDAADRRSAASRILLNATPGYKHSQHIWWALLATGLVATLISWLMGQFMPNAMTVPTSPEGILTIALMVLAYAMIIIAFIYDWRTVRPMRTAAEAMANSLTEKKLSQVLNGDAGVVAREQAAKDKARAAKRSGKSKRREQHK
ncbi:MAG: hypothetical protein J6D54_10155 [Olsenella sp.]|nr:hypothetical protein [Olsenella sp.]